MLSTRPAGRRRPGSRPRPACWLPPQSGSRWRSRRPPGGPGRARRGSQPGRPAGSPPPWVSCRPPSRRRPERQPAAAPAPGPAARPAARWKAASCAGPVPARQHRGGVGQLTRDPVQADAGQPDLGLGGQRRVADQDDIPVGRQDIACPLGEAALQADVNCPSQVGDGELGRLPGVQQNRAGLLPGQDIAKVQKRRRALIQQRMRLPVGAGIEGEVAGTGGLPLGNHGDEGVLPHVLQRVVGAPLLPDRRGRVGRQRLAACRARPVGWVDPGGIGQDKELVTQRPVQAPR